jgi:Zn-dependent protease with chaperone function
MTTAVVLTAIAVALAWPVPHLLARASWPHRSPRSAIVLWQAVGLAGGVSALLAALAIGLAPLAPRLTNGLVDHANHLADGQPLRGLGPLNLLGLALAAALAARLFTVLYLSTSRTVRERRRHRHLVDLAGRSHPRQDNPHHLRCGLCDHETTPRHRLRILDHPVAVAYCVPGVRRPRVVVSAGLLETLSSEELEAVLAHEEAHARGRHDLVIQPFVAWQATFPFLRPAGEATAAVCLLIEMLADDQAARRTGGRPLARALARIGVARAPVPVGVLGITGNSLVGALVSPARWGGDHRGPADHAAAALAASGPVGRTAALGAHRSPVITRVSRLLDPPRVPLWLPAAGYLAAAWVLALPVLAIVVT